MAVPEEQFRRIPARFGKAPDGSEWTFHDSRTCSRLLYRLRIGGVEGDAYLDSEFLKAQRDSGKSVQVEGDKTLTVSIKASEIPVDSR